MALFVLVDQHTTARRTGQCLWVAGGATVARSHIYANTRTEPAMTPPRTSKANRGWESPTSSRPKGRVSSPPTDTLKFSLSRGASLQAGFLE